MTRSLVFQYASSPPRRMIKPGTVTVSWSTGNESYQLTDDGLGALEGAGGGSVSYATGLAFLSPSPAPIPSDGNYSIEFTQWNGETKQVASVAVNHSGDTVLNPAAEIEPGSLRIDVQLRRLKKRVVRLVGDPIEQWEDAPATLADDGDGNLTRERDGEILGTVNYATGAITFDARQEYEFDVETQVEPPPPENPDDPPAKTYWETDTATETEVYKDSSNANFEWADPADPSQVKTVQYPIPGMVVNLTPHTQRPIIPGSVLFSLGGVLYRDQAGAIVRNWSPVTNAGQIVGSIDYADGLVTLNDFPANTPTSTPITLLACATSHGETPSDRTIFRTAGAPLREASLIVNGFDILGGAAAGNAQSNGDITGAGIEAGFVDTQTGIAEIEWSVAIRPSTVTYSAVSYTYLPLDASLVGLDATRLPGDGRVPQFNLADVLVISHTKQHEIAEVTDGLLVDFERLNQAEVWVVGANGAKLDPVQYTLDPDEGTLTFADPVTLEDVDSNPVTEPVTIHERVEDMALATDVQIGGQISLNIPLSQDYPADETIVSSAVLYGDIRARVHNIFHQATWTNVWSDERIGNDTTAKYNSVAHPLEITNQGAIKERWAIRFTSTSSFEVLGETVGVIATGNISADCAPSNPATGTAYFMIRKEGWGSGWVSGNTLRFNTDGGQAPFWVARTVTPGRAQELEDQFSTQNRGDAD